MQKVDEPRFVAVMKYLTLNFPERNNGNIHPDLLRSYFHDLSDLNIEDVEKAARAYVRIGDKFPFVSDLRKSLQA